MSTFLIKEYKEKITKSSLYQATKGYIGAVLGIFVLVLFLFNATGCVQGVGGNSDIQPMEEAPQGETPAEELPKENVKYGDDGVNAGIAPDADDVTIVSQQKPEDSQIYSSIAISDEDLGRSDPFLPEREKVIVTVKPKNYGYDLLPPPEIITTDEHATEVIGTKVSGIMYDSYNPSAILNINSSDYLVRTGDIINDYKVLAISKDNVTVQYGANVYKAGVGELFTGKGIHYNKISNLDKKFGGAKNSTSR